MSRVVPLLCYYAFTFSLLAFFQTRKKNPPYFRLITLNFVNPKCANSSSVHVSNPYSQFFVSSPLNFFFSIFLQSNTHIIKPAHSRTHSFIKSLLIIFLRFSIDFSTLFLLLFVYPSSLSVITTSKNVLLIFYSFPLFLASLQNRTLDISI